jgi:uncharacterized RDD family membrane protein YckC
MQNSSDTSSQPAAPGFLRRMAAILYDSMLVGALLLMAIALVVIPLDLVFGTENLDIESLRYNPFYLAYLFCIMAGFHILFWIRGGQTLGMRAWRVRVVRNDGLGLSFKDAVIRYLSAILSWALFGLGFFWILLDRDGLAWHDRISKTKLIIQNKG